MVVRIRLQTGRPLERKQGKNRHLALAFGALLVPAALMAYVLAIWSLASDMEMTGAFGITGFFSHWQIWIALAASLHAGSRYLNRYGRGHVVRIPRILMFRPLTYPFRDRSTRRAGESQAR
jgi:hypothetical protein